MYFYLDVDECSRCYLNVFCVNMLSLYICVCNVGFSGDGYDCSDMDECVLNLYYCNIFVNCFNMYGLYGCNCLMGFVGNNSVCKDVDECV